MSYCRFSEGDVYAYECAGGVQFYVRHDKGELDCLCRTFNEAYVYAKELRDIHGLDVPSYAIEALKEDAIEEAKYGPNSAVAELEAENGQLRELVRDMWRFTGEACKKYPRLFDPVAPGGQMVRLNPIDAFEQRIAELGIEVDQ